MLGDVLWGQRMKVAIIDTETTGVAAHDEPISVGIVLVEIEINSGKLVKEISRYHGWREPRVAIHPKAQAVHGKTSADLVGKALDLMIVTSLINEADVLIAHNAQFDARMLLVVCDVASGKPWRCSLHQFPWPSVIGRKRLDSVCEFYGIARPSCHDALADCEALLNALLVHTGKTARSRTFLALLLAKAPLGFSRSPEELAQPRHPTYQLSRADRVQEPHPPGRPISDQRPRRPQLTLFETVAWGIVLLVALFVGLGAHS